MAAHLSPIVRWRNYIRWKHLQRRSPLFGIICSMKPIKAYSPAELSQLLAEEGQPSFRTKQLLEWLYVHPVRTYDEMTNLPAQLRSRLFEIAPLTQTEIIERLDSKDGSSKYLLRLYDGNVVECVAIPSSGSRDRLTLCLSSQVGCAMACRFCATGAEGFNRNLLLGEMVDQVNVIQQDLGLRVSNIVVMGQGEPFLNYENTMGALRIINDPKGIAIGARKITISTCGILSGITRLSKEPEQFTLAISLHSARQEVRNELMPHVASYPLGDLRRAIIAYIEETNRRVTFEYLLLDGINDSQKDLDALMAFCNGLLCHVNILPMNPVQGSPYQPSPQKIVNKWIEALETAGISTTLRTSRGSDIQGACGQLKNPKCFT
ncbi:MAG: 23S rRNA (adenine(2503)-C(2))-methyltransferase RlmN [Eggerthellaceae bacterium]|nr:23S rRNA (adenine(2503)-C(2))-methyltransferase RlmN [Eggerthellaceae bacterium]